MARKYSWRIKKNYFNLINNGTKTLEVRVGYSDIKRVKKGDCISFENYGKNNFEVVRVTVYNDFAEMLDSENSQLIIPKVTKYKALHMLQEIYTEEKEKLGVYVFELKKQVDSKKILKILSARQLSKTDRKNFGKVLEMSYFVTDYICKDYPAHFKWFWEKTVPAVLNGTREVLTCLVDGKVAAVAFLKNENGEKKICTFLVLEEYRGLGIAIKLIEKSFDFLGTDKPLITLADYKLPMFEGIIKKYNWKQTQILPVGYYNNSSKELVFNGKIE